MTLKRTTELLKEYLKMNNIIELTNLHISINLHLSIG